MPARSLHRRLQHLFATFVVALVATPALAQGEPALLSPGSQTPAATKTAPVDRLVLRQRPVDVNAAPLLAKAAQGGTTFTIELFDGERVVVDTMHAELRGAGNATYFGKVRGQARSEVVLTFVDGHLAAELTLDVRGRFKQYRIQAQPDGGHWLQEIDGDGFPPDHPGGANALPAVKMERLLEGKRGDISAQDDGSTVDLLVVYSNQTAAAAGAAIGSQIQAAVDRSNLAYASSGVAMRLRLVHHAQAGYSEVGDFSTDLSRLAGTSDGYMDSVHALRNTYGADVVTLFIESGSACGIGYIGPSSGSAFNVVSRGCAAGNLSLAHEIGHNFGARHDTYVDGSTTPYAYGHGYAYPAGGWRTVMAYNNACTAAGTSCTRLANLSNPNVTYNSVPMGSAATADVARVHSGNAYTVANFRQATGGGCSYALSPASASVAASGGSGSTNVTAGAGCAWNAASNAAWLTIGAGSGASGSGALNYVAAANSGPARSGAISVGGVPFTVSQANGCTYTVAPISATATAAGGNASIAVTAAAGCAWTATSGAAWLTIVAGANGTGNGSVTYGVATNGGALRTGNLTIAGATVTVTQAAATAPPTVTASLSPTTLDFGSIAVNKRSSVLTASYRNTGTGALTISAITLGGAHPGDFLTRNNCTAGQTLAAGQSCTLGYAFTPKATGARSAAATITSNAGSHTLSLVGTGLPRGKP